MTDPTAGERSGQSSGASRFIKPTLATIAVVIGGIALLTSLFTLDFAGVLISIAFLLPGAWWFLHERKAKSGAPMKRHWGVIAAVAVVAFIGGGLLLPATEPTEEAEAAVETTSAAPTSTSTSAPRPTTSTPRPTTTARPSRTTTTPTTTTREPAPAPAPARREPTPERTYTPPPAPAPDPAPAPAPEPEYTPPPAPAPESVYYANCTAARAAGAAPVLVGQPGYGTHLDRDGDGIGCEN